MKIKEKIRSVLNNGVALSVASILSFLAPLMYYSYRFGWVYVDIVLFSGFGMTMFFIMVINAILGLFIDICLLYGVKIKEKAVKYEKWFFILHIAHFALTAIFTVIWLVYVGVSGGESAPVGMRFLSEAIPIFLLIYGGIALLVFFPRIVKRKPRAILGGAILVIILFSVIFSVFPGYVYKINSHPIVIDNGKEYVVVFSTNDYGTGYVEYAYNSVPHKVYDENNGRLNGDSYIHTIKIPYEHLENNSYRVGSVRVIDELSYGGRTGAERVSGEYKFHSAKNEAEQRYLMISDWHTHVKKAKKAISYAGEYDGVIMLGDSAPGLNFEEEVVKYIVQFGGDITNGSVPIIFARGNHETRGRYAGKLADDLGMDKFYFTVDTGDFTFLILDSGEDKVDSHPEYGGMVNYEKYRENMINWLNEVEIDENDDVITVVHSKSVAIEKYLSGLAYKRLEELGSRYVFSGHTHVCRLAESLSENIITYEDGGFKNNVYIASKITVRRGDIDIEAWDNFGNKVFDNDHK